MSTPNCSDFVTRQEYNQLLYQLQELQFQIDGVLNLVNDHIGQNIPKAHKYQPSINVNTSLSENNELITEVTVDNSSDSSTLPLPDSIVPNVTFDIFNTSDGGYLFKVGINGEFDEDTLYIEEKPLNFIITNPAENQYQFDLTLGEQQKTQTLTINRASNLKIDGSYQNDYLTLIVADGNSQDTAEILISIPEPEQISEPHVQSNLKIDTSYRNNILTISVADGESFDAAQVFIDTNSSPQTIFVTEEVYMNCDELERKIDNCCSLIINHITDNKNIVVAELEETENNLKNEIDSAENIINNNLRDITDKVEIIDEAVTIDISGEINSGYKCEFARDKDGKIKPDYALASFNNRDDEDDKSPFKYSGTGLVGLHQILLTISNNLDAIYRESCAAVDPIMEITLNDMYSYCGTSEIKREDYADDEEGQKRYDLAINTYFYELQKDSKYGYLINNPNDPDLTGGNVPYGDLSLIQAPTNWTNYIISDFALIQSRTNKNILCDFKEAEPTDVVSIVASDKVIPNATGKHLILHFVTLDNYPKRGRNSSYWQVQIPAAKEEYSWQEDFENLRFARGNQYAELRFQEFKNPVSGWFESVEAANSYFNTVLSLTTATEKNRVYPTHSNPQTAVVARLTRPYRAFIESINDQGQAVCHIKYKPVIDSANND